MASVYEGVEKRINATPTGLVIPIWIASVLVVSFMGSGGFIIQQQIQNGYNLGIMTVKLVALNDQVRAGMTDRYRAEQASSDFALRDVHILHLDEQMKEIKQDIARCQKRLRDMEDVVHNLSTKHDIYTADP